VRNDQILPGLENVLAAKDVIARIIETTGGIPPLPQTASLVMEKLMDPNATPHDIHRVISSDQALAARVLRIANSSFYGASRTVTRLTDAIMMMGFEAIKSLIMTAALRDSFPQFGFAEKLIWEHSLACAYAARQIAAAVKWRRSEDAFLAGLMHDIGKAILILGASDSMRAIVQEVYNTPGMTFMKMEQEAFGFDHTQVGEVVAEQWNFAAPLKEAIAKHHSPDEARLEPILAHITSLANAFCHKLGAGATKNPDLNLAEVESARALELGEISLNELASEMSQILKSQDPFAV
jgi:putative nucleotidyltransferase with HDIG domain